MAILDYNSLQISIEIVYTISHIELSNLQINFHVYNNLRPANYSHQPQQGKCSTAMILQMPTFNYRIFIAKDSG